MSTVEPPPGGTGPDTTQARTTTDDTLEHSPRPAPEDTMSSTDDLSAPGTPTPGTPRDGDLGATASTLVVEEPQGPAVGTLAWGLVALAVAGVLAAREVADVQVDLSYALPAGMLALGALLLVGAVVAALRQR